MEIKKLISWSKKKYSSLPWREKRSVYSTWISEVMLQQTTVYTVKNRLHDFLNKFPSVENLAQASEEELLTAWKGLGYYQRAKNLKKAAQYISNELNGVFPEKIEELQKIPGIGPYTSSALLSIGMNKKALAIDANLERVLARYYGITSYKGALLKKDIEEKFLSHKILNHEPSSWCDLNEALMDLGREVCQSRKVECVLCPIRKGCKASLMSDPLSIPRVSPKVKKEKFELDLIRIIYFKGGKIAAIKKEKGEWLSGQYEIPTFILKTSDSNLNQYPVYPFHFDDKLEMIKTGITKYKIKNYFKTIDSSNLKKLKIEKEVVFLDLPDASKKLSTASLKILRKKWI